MIYLIEMSGTMHGSMPEVVQQAEMPSLTRYNTRKIAVAHQVLQ